MGDRTRSGYAAFVDFTVGDDREANAGRDAVNVERSRGEVNGSVSVVVSRRVREGSEREYVRWASRISAAAASAPGFLGTELQTPDDVHPDEWVTVYRFATVEQLDAWLTSPRRAELLAEVDTLVEGPAREQIIVEPVQSDRPVTVVMSQRVPAERAEQFAAAHRRVLAELAKFPGFLRSELFPPVDGVTDEHTIVFAFDSREHLDAWLESEERRAWLAHVAPLITGDRRMNVIGGFAGWFPATGSPQPPKWKQALAVLLALFPVALALTALRQVLLPDLPLVPSVLLSNALGVAALTWVLMPAVTRLLGPWLQR